MFSLFFIAAHRRQMPFLGRFGVFLGCFRTPRFRGHRGCQKIKTKITHDLKYEIALWIARKNHIRAALSRGFVENIFGISWPARSAGSGGSWGHGGPKWPTKTAVEKDDPQAKIRRGPYSVVVRRPGCAPRGRGIDPVCAGTFSDFLLWGGGAEKKTCLNFKRVPLFTPYLGGVKWDHFWPPR